MFTLENAIRPSRPATVQIPTFWQSIGLGAILVAAVFVAYLPAMNGGFVCDDNDDVVGNAALQSLQGLYEIWFQPGISSQFYPFTFTSFWLNVQAGGSTRLAFIS